MTNRINKIQKELGKFFSKTQPHPLLAIEIVKEFVKVQKTNHVDVNKLKAFCILNDFNFKVREEIIRTEQIFEWWQGKWIASQSQSCDARYVTTYYIW